MIFLKSVSVNVMKYSDIYCNNYCYPRTAVHGRPTKERAWMVVTQFMITASRGALVRWDVFGW